MHHIRHIQTLIWQLDKDHLRIANALKTFVGRDSVVGIATTLRTGRSGNGIPVEARFSAPVHTGPGAHSASCTWGTGFLPGAKRLGRGTDHQPPSTAEVTERVELHLYSPSGPSKAYSRVNFDNVHLKGPYFTENTARLHHKNQPVNEVIRIFSPWRDSP
jgi:hypothetical protein